VGFKWDTMVMTLSDYLIPTTFWQTLDVVGTQQFDGLAMVLADNHHQWLHKCFNI